MTQPPPSPSAPPGRLRPLLLGLLLGQAFLVAPLAAQDDADLYRVRGVLGSSAFVDDLRSGEQVAVRAGDTLGDLTVKRVEATRVLFERGDGSVLELPISPRSGDDTPVREEGAPAAEADSGPRAQLKLTAAGTAYFEILPEKRKFSARAGEMLGDQWKLVEVSPTSVVLEGASGTREIAPGEQVPATNVFTDVAQDAGDPIQGLAYIGQGGTKAMFQLDGPSGQKQVTAARGEQIRPGLELVDFDASRATVRDLARGTEQHVRRSRATSPGDDGDRSMAPAGGRVPPYPWRIPLWERDLEQLMDDTRITLRLTDRDLDECVEILRDRHGLPLLLDPDVLEELDDATLSADLRADQTPAREAVLQLVAEKSLMVEPAFGALVVGLPRNLVAVAEARLVRDDTLAEIEDLREQLASIPGIMQNRWEESLAEQLRFVRAEVPAEVDTLGEIVRFIEEELSIPSSMPAADRSRRVEVEAGRHTLEELLVHALEGIDLEYRWSGNALILLSPADASAEDARRAALEEQRTTLRSELLEFPRESPLGLEAATTGPLWFVCRSVNAAGRIEVVADAAAWSDPLTELRLPAGATLGDLLDALAPFHTLQAVRASDVRLVVLSLR